MRLGVGLWPSAGGRRIGEGLTSAEGRPGAGMLAAAGLSSAGEGVRGVEQKGPAHRGSKEAALPASMRDLGRTGAALTVPARIYLVPALLREVGCTERLSAVQAGAPWATAARRPLAAVEGHTGWSKCSTFPTPAAGGTVPMRVAQRWAGTPCREGVPIP